ncbi:MerR family transcriptional regulator [bacterium]|nr:MerR family transcriptional regulator [bacterium]
MSDKPQYLTVKEAAKVLGVNPETLRRWDNIGKLKTKRHPMNNYRIYDPVEVEALRKSILGGKTQ